MVQRTLGWGLAVLVAMAWAGGAACAEGSALPPPEVRVIRGPGGVPVEPVPPVQPVQSVAPRVQWQGPRVVSYVAPPPPSAAMVVVQRGGRSWACYPSFRLDAFGTFTFDPRQDDLLASGYDDGRPVTARYLDDDHDGAFGAGGRLAWSPDGTNQVELRATWFGTLKDWQREVAVIEDPGGGTVDAVVAHDLERVRELLVGDFGWRRRLGRPGPKVAFEGTLGVRGFRLSDDVTALRNVSPDAAANGSWGVDVDQTFLGGRGGLGVLYRPAPAVELGLLVEGFVGWLDWEVERRDAAGPMPGLAVSDEDLAWGVQADLSARFRLSSRLSALLGASVLYVDGVRVAGESFDLASGAVPDVLVRESDLLFVTVYAGIGIDF